MERVTRAQGHPLMDSAKAASNLDARTFKVPYPVSRGAVSLTAAGLDLAVKEEVFAGSAVEQVCFLFADLNLIFSFYSGFLTATQYARDCASWQPSCFLPALHPCLGVSWAAIPLLLLPGPAGCSCRRSQAPHLSHSGSLCGEVSPSVCPSSWLWWQPSQGHGREAGNEFGSMHYV